MGLFHGRSENLERKFLQPCGLSHIVQDVSLVPIFELISPSRQVRSDPAADFLFLTPTHELAAEVMAQLVPEIVPLGTAVLRVDKQLIEIVGGRRNVVTSDRVLSVFRRTKKSRVPVSVYVWAGAEMYASCTTSRLENKEPVVVLDWEPDLEHANSAQRAVVVRCQRMTGVCFSSDPRCPGCRRCVVRSELGIFGERMEVQLRTHVR